MKFPTIGTYRQVLLHAFQRQDRIESVVKPEIDRVYTIADPGELLTYASMSTNPPEARLFAAAKLEAIFELSVERRESRPDIDPERVRAVVAGLNSLEWIDPAHFCSLLDTPPDPDLQGPRDPENAAALESAKQNQP